MGNMAQPEDLLPFFLLSSDLPVADLHSPSSGYSDTGFTTTPDDGSPTNSWTPDDFSSSSFDWLEIKKFLRTISPTTAAYPGALDTRLAIALPLQAAIDFVSTPFVFAVQHLPSIAGESPLDWLVIEDIISLLDVDVQGPSGVSVPVTLQLDNDFRRILCFFRPFLPGSHTISVRLLGLGDRHIMGSPFERVFTRNYPRVRHTRPVVHFNINNGPAPEKDELKPWGLCINPETDVIYVADRTNNEIRAFSPEGELLFKFGVFGEEPGQFNRPTGLVFDGKSRLLITDKDNNRVQVFTASGDFLSTFGKRGHAAGQFMFPWGIAVSSEGLIAVADSRNSRVQLFDAEYNFLRKFSVRADDPIGYKDVFNYPRGIAFSPRGDFMYVTDFNLHRVFRLDTAFTSCQGLETAIPMARPQGITVDEAGNILVCSSRQHSIKVFDPHGEFLFEIKSLNDVPFDLPLDIITTKAGFIAVLDFNGRVRIF